jgi:hypothetical protein
MVKCKKTMDDWYLCWASGAILERDFVKCEDDTLFR